MDVCPATRELALGFHSNQTTPSSAEDATTLSLRETTPSLPATEKGTTSLTKR
jgi:hypothetical protein